MASPVETLDDSMHESTYEIVVDESSLSEDDDTSSVASFDDNSGEDVVSISGSELLSEYAVDYITDSERTSENGGIPTFGGLDEHTIQSLDTRSDLTKDIVFEEPTSVGRSTVTYAVRDFTHEEAKIVSEQLRFDLPDSMLKLSLRQSLIPQTLSVDQPFRVLYVGPDHAKDLIISKIGGALAVTALDNSDSLQCDSKPARFNVVPVSSFGTTGSPDIELVESFGVEIVVDSCTEARMEKDGTTEIFCLTLNKHQNVRVPFKGDSTKSETGSWRKPNMAVLMCAESDDLHAKELRMEARRFLSKFGIPTQLITERSAFEKPLSENFLIDVKTLHFCVESVDSQQKPIVHRRIPVDLTHFLTVDVRQLNRNLASVTGLYVEHHRIESVSKPMVDQAVSLGDDQTWAKSQTKRSTPWRPNGVQIRLALLAWILLCGALGSLGKISLSRYFIPETLPTTATPVLSSSNGIPVKPKVTSTVSLSTLKPSTSPSSITSTSSCHPLLASSSANVFLENQDLFKNLSQEFKLRVIGDNNILLRPSHQFTILKRPPKLHVKVTRYGTAIPSEFSKLFSGVYALQIPYDEAWGPLNVSVTTKSRPLLDETFEVDFGRPWLKVSRWRSLASESSAHALHSLAQIREKAARSTEQTRVNLSERSDAVVLRLYNYIADVQKTQATYLNASKEASRAALRRAQGQAAKLWRGQV